MRRRQIVIAIYFLAMFTFSAAGSTSMLVLYPKVSAPYSQIFDEIITGIEQQFDGEVSLKSIEKSDSNEELSNWINNEDPQMLIALGRRGYKLIQNIQNEKPVVIGALPIKPNGIAGVSLLADPHVLFDALQQLAPNIKRVHVVYSENSEWLVQLAEVQSESMGLTLNKIKAVDIKSALLEYDKLLSTIDIKTDALWLPLDPVTVNEQVILPSLLERSWEQNLVLFSSKPAHAKRGALFSMFPNHLELGKQLAKMVEIIYKTRQSEGVVPLQKMRLAVNLRTAAHLGFEYKNRQKEQFHVTFP
jgi:putative ABC transport system substrate-binding protein